MKSAKGIARLPAWRQAGSAETEFLPAALEIAETPPSPIGRATALTIAAVFAAAIAWASLGTVDIVAVASGKIIPTGRTKSIQPFETGVVRAIYVRDGQAVKAGDVLIELDPTMSGAELGHLKSDLQAAELDMARLRAALLGKSDPASAFVPPPGAPGHLIDMHRSFLVSQLSEQEAKLAAIDRQIAQKQAEQATVNATIEKVKAILDPLRQRVAIREELVKQELTSKVLYLSELQELMGQQQEIVVQRRRAAEVDAAIAALVETRTRTVAEFERALYDEMNKARQKAAVLEQDIIKAEQRRALQTLAAPVDGVVQQLAVHTIGGVVTPAQMLMAIVPADSGLEIEAMVSNRDVGFVEAGQGASIKVDTFNFTRYGLIDGTVLFVSQDAILRDRPQDRGGDKAPGAEQASSEPKGQEMVYAARVSLGRTQMQVENRSVNLMPGMAVTVEIKTGTRSVISYLMSPLVRYRQESLRER